jgi:hypothetical protein
MAVEDGRVSASADHRQNEAIDAISKAVRRARAGLKDPRRPISSFIFPWKLRAW